VQPLLSGKDLYRRAGGQHDAPDGHQAQGGQSGDVELERF